MRSVGLVSGVLAAALFACGGGGSGGGQTCTPGPTFTLTISATGVSPANACVTPGGAVTFKNSDTVQHHVAFTPAAGFPSCPAATDVNAGASQDVAFPTTTQCTYAVSGTGSSFTGTVVASDAVQSGGGY